MSNLLLCGVLGVRSDFRLWTYLVSGSIYAVSASLSGCNFNAVSIARLSTQLQLV